MKLLKLKLTISIILVLDGIGAAGAQDAVEKLQPLVTTSAHRLAIAKQVAFAKWDSQAPVEDVAREAQLIAGAVKDGQSKGLEGIFVSKFVTAQIEANKLVQYSLLASWHRMGGAPVHSRVNLAATIRPELDQLQKELISELVDTAPIRASATCRRDSARAVGKYLETSKDDPDLLMAIALDRAMAANCI
jgi:chorismate mutase